MIAETIPQIQTMGTQEKFQLAVELWQDVIQHEDEIQDPPGIAAMLEDRLARHRENGFRQLADKSSVNKVWWQLVKQLHTDPNGTELRAIWDEKRACF